MVRKILEEKLISVPEVKEILVNVGARLEKMQKNFDAFQQASFEYANSFAKMSAEAAVKVTKMLQNDYGMDASHAIQMVNIDPNTPQEARVVLEKDIKVRNLSDNDLVVMIQKIRDLQN